MSKILAQGMITLTQLYEGVQVILSPTAVLIPCDSEENPKPNAYINASTNVKAFLGTMDITSGITLGELEYSDSTVKASKTGTKVSITTITTRTGYVDIPVSATINGETIDLGKHRFNFVKQIDGQPGIPGDPGFGYTLNIKGGTRGVAYAANGTNPEPKTSSQFSVELLKNGVKVANPASISWTCGGNLSGSSSTATFTPTIKSTYNSESSYVKVSIKEFAVSVAVEETIPIVCTKHADGLDWINEWNNQYVQVGTEKIITPKIFAGTKNNANELTGVAIGRDVLGGNANKVIGIVGYKKNTPVFSLDQDANFFVSSSGSAGDVKNGTNNAKGLYFDGNDLYISGRVRINGGSTIGESNTSVEEVINNSNLGAQANNKIDNLSIGGRNLMPDSAPKTTGGGWAGTPGTKTLVSDISGPFGQVLKATYSATGARGGVFKNPKAKLTVGKTYSWSVWLKASKAMTMDIGLEQGGVRKYNITTSWQKITHTFTAVDESRYAFIMYVNGTTVNSGDYYLFHSIMVEEGNKPSDWSPAPEDIDSAINDKANVADVYKKTETYSKTQTESAIEVAKNEINLGISSTYETKTNVETKITNTTNSLTNKINNIQIGGRNLLVGTATPKSGNFNCPTGFSTFDPYTTSGKKTLADLGFKSGDEVTISFDWKISKNGSLAEVYGHFKLEWKGIKSDGTDNMYVGAISNLVDTFSASNKSGHVVIVTKLDSNTVKAHTLRFRIDNSVLAFTVSNVMVEKGNKASSWTPAPEDIQADINAKANSVDVYKKTETYNRTETDSKINIAKDQINLNVSNTYETKSNVETKVNSAVNELKVGGSNVLRNGNFAYDMTNWSVHDMNSGGTSKSVAVENGGGDWKPANKKVLVIKGTNTTDRYGVISSTMKLIPKTKYTISGYCAGHRVNKIQVNVRDRQGSDANIHTININPVSGGSTLDKWHRFETTFTTSSNSDFALNLYSVNLADNGYVWFCDVQIQQGTKATAWTPCLEDINSAINTKANSTDVYKKTETYSKTETDAKIKTTNDSITSSVSKLQTNIDKVQWASAQNLLYNSDFLKIVNGFPHEWTRSNSSIVTMNDGWLFEGAKAIKISATGLTTDTYDAAFSPFVKVNAGQVVTASVYSNSTTWSTCDYGAHLQIEFWNDKDRLEWHTVHIKPSDNSAGWKRYSKTNTAPSGTTRVRVRFHNQRNGTFYIAKPMLQFGSTLTGWSRGGDLTTITERVATAESKITNDAIVNTVTSSTAWKQTSNVVNQMTQGTRCHKLGAKINYSEFGVQNSGEMYLHGYNSNNEPADVNGSIVFSGVTHTLAKGMVNPNADFGLGVDVYLFKNPNTSYNATYGAYYDTSSNTWKWRGLVGATGSGNISMNEGYIAFGQFNMKDAETFNYATLYNEPVLLKNCVSYKEEVSGQYATKSSLTQTTNSIIAKFEASGGYNLFKNSGFLTGDISQWGIQQHNSPTASWSIISHSNTWGFPDSSVKTFQVKMSNQTNKEYGLSQTINTTIGKKYTISFYCAAHRANNANIIVRRGDGTWLSNKFFNPQDSTKNGGNTSVDKWLYVTHTFTATGNSHAINLVLVNAQSDGYFWIAKPQVVEGEAPLSYSPNPSEVYSGNTVIDARGVTVTNGGFKVKNTSNKDVFWVDSNGQATVDNLQVYGNGASTINVYGNGHKHLKFESWTSHGAQISFNQLTGQNSVLVGRMITYPDIGNNVFLEADEAITIRSTRSTPSYNVECPLKVVGQVYGTAFKHWGDKFEIIHDGADLRLKNNVINKSLHISNNGNVYFDNHQLITCHGDNNTYSLTRKDGYFELLTNDGAKGLTYWNSDLKFKNNVQSVNTLKTQEDIPIIGLELINNIEHYTFDYKDGGKHINVGYVAQQLEKLDETLITKIEQPKESPYWSEEDPYTRQPEVSTILPNVTLAIQEQQQIINAQSIEIEELKQKNEELEKRLKLIEEKLGL